MDKLEFENFEYASAAEQTPINEETNEPSLTHEEAIDMSKKIVDSLEAKAKEHNKAYPKAKVYLDQLKKIYVRGAAMRADDGKDNASWAMARVNMYMRMKCDGLISFGAKNQSSVSFSKVDEYIDISNEWHPEEEDFILAKKDNENYGLKEFDNIDDLYLEGYERVEFNWRNW